MEKSNWIHSNTSHVIVYPISFRESSSAGAYSNTSHVIVYPFLHSIHKEMIIFKYISCYCLSQDGRGSSSVCGKFKYISCYCLSRSRKVISGERIIQIHLMLLFIGFNKSLAGTYTDSNTSHVIVYRYCYFPMASHIQDSNTSHVIVYLGSKEVYYVYTEIQIHLMLLFIIC